jgi:glycosyltransferase involved in cell wall biosynthesis
VLSAILIAKDEEADIGDAIRSVSFADEVVVVDSGSSDRTVEIARELGARVVSATDWRGFGVQKNRALDAAQGDWVLSLDADERVPPELAAEIQAAMRAGAGHAAYEMPRLSRYCGRFMRHGGWWPDHVTRLFKRGAARFSDDIVHERLVVEGTVGRLASPILHHAFENLEEVLRKVDSYSSANARMLHARGRRGSLTKALLHGGWAFFRTYVLRAGFLDGRHGFMLAVSNAEGTYYRYLKLMLLGDPPR